MRTSPPLPARQPALHTPQPRGPWRGRLAALAACALLLAAVLHVHGAGQPLLATPLLAVGGLAVWVYTQPRAHAFRHVFPGLAAALVFVVFPMLVTVWLGFTNYSSRNRFTEDEVRQALLADAAPAEGTQHAFELLGSDAAAQLRLTAPDGQRWLTPPVPLRPRPANAPLVAQPEQAAATLGAAVATAPASTARPLREVVSHLDTLRSWQVQTPDGKRLSLSGLREFAQMQPLYRVAPDGVPGGLVNVASGSRWTPDATTGFFTREDGATLRPATGCRWACSTTARC
jgi:maltose/maltodextrin transport system permease protein